jgi:hypothetical protein
MTVNATKAASAGFYTSRWASIRIFRSSPWANY